MKRFDDPKSRPFLNAHFDVQEYIKDVITDGRSEETYNDITSCIEDVNDEIKNYITQHKDTLMSGMQDVAILASKYQSLASMSTKLRRSVDKLKKEALDSHDLVKSRTAELERLHSTSTSLRLLRQFAHSKSQLDHHLKTNPKDSKDCDPRQLASIAKYVNELEGLLNQPALQNIAIVMEQVSPVRSFGLQLRQVAQERLLVALRERNQATMAGCLQIFFNLQSLPEVLLLAIDSTVRFAVELSREALDLDALLAAHPELTGSVSTASTPATKQAAVAPTPKKDASAVLSQLRVAMRELCSEWASLMYDQAMHVLMLQRVVAKKEDPATHKRFSEVLKTSTATSPLLCSGRLVDLFWERLASSLEDVVADMLRSQAVAASRLYPSLRRAAVDIHFTIQGLVDRDNSHTEDSGGADRNEVAVRQAHIVTSKIGMFGCAAWPQEQVSGSGRVASPSSAVLTAPPDLKTSSLYTGSGSVGSSSEAVLVTGLQLMRDRYLGSLYSRLTDPIAQMFPEVEGFMAAVPSKRDLQAFLTAAQGELVAVIVESDSTLLKNACKELGKAVRFLLTKAEGMILVGPDAKKISPQHNFARTSQQEHNGQLVALLTQLRDSLAKLAGQVSKTASESLQQLPISGLMLNIVSSSSSGGLSQTQMQTQMDNLQSELTDYLSGMLAVIDDLVLSQLVLPAVDYLAAYCRGVIVGLLREGAAVADDTQPSRAVQLLARQMPELLKHHLLSLPKCKAVTTGIQELKLRIQATFVSTASTLRPLSEATRVRTATDMAAIDLLLDEQDSEQRPGDPNPVSAEFKAFRRLLTEETIPRPVQGVAMPVSAEKLAALPYLAALRPSVLFGHVCSCAPVQLPSVSDTLRTSPEELVDTMTRGPGLSLVSDFYRPDWRKVPSEAKYWEAVRDSLDVLLQRATVADAGQQKVFRAWVDLLRELGESLFSEYGWASFVDAKSSVTVTD